MAPKGSGALWASRSVQDILDPWLAACFGVLQQDAFQVLTHFTSVKLLCGPFPSKEPAIISSDNSPETTFQKRFDYIGTRDYSSWCAMGAALDFRRMLGGEVRLQRYTSELAKWAGQMMAEAFGTETVVPVSICSKFIESEISLTDPVGIHLHRIVLVLSWCFLRTSHY